VLEIPLIDLVWVFFFFKNSLSLYLFCIIKITILGTLLELHGLIKAKWNETLCVAFYYIRHIVYE
jgi:hypothetical protein